MYYTYTGYSGFISASAQLAGARTRLSLRFSYCNGRGGVLLQAMTDPSSNGGYFSVGITSMQQLLVEFTDGGGTLTRVTYRVGLYGAI